MLTEREKKIVQITLSFRRKDADVGIVPDYMLHHVKDFVEISEAREIRDIVQENRNDY